MPGTYRGIHDVFFLTYNLTICTHTALQNDTFSHGERRQTFTLGIVFRLLTLPVFLCYDVVILVYYLY